MDITLRHLISSVARPVASCSSSKSIPSNWSGILALFWCSASVTVTVTVTVTVIVSETVTVTVTVSVTVTVIEPVPVPVTLFTTVNFRPSYP